MKTKLKMYALFASLIFASCADIYDHYTFTKTLETQVMVENLFKRSTTQQYSDNLASINELQLQLQTMLEYEKTKKDNLIMQKMWELHNSEGSALQGFFKQWKAQGTMSEVFIQEFTPEVSRMFDLMVDYENSKSKQSENILNQALNAITQ